MDSVVSFLPVDHWSGEGEDAPVQPRAAEALNAQFQTQAAAFYPSGRQALDGWLGTQRLGRGDEIWITTSFDLPNVSSCVTCTIFNHCKPSRVLTAATRGILVIHEFGVPHPHMQELAAIARSKDIPIIEDCAHTADSRDNGFSVGTLGEWVLLSFPKIFPIRSGGALLSRSGQALPAVAATMPDLERFVAEHAPRLPDYSARRRAAFARLEAAATACGYEPLFSPRPSISPWFFPLRTQHGHELISALQAAGVDAASWHGSDLVVLPCHQFLTEPDFMRVESVLQSRPGSTH